MLRVLASRPGSVTRTLNHWYHVRKTAVSPGAQLALKKELTALVTYGNDIITVPFYSETADDLLLPRCFGVEKFGIPVGVSICMMDQANTGDLLQAIITKVFVLILIIRLTLWLVGSNLLIMD